MKILKLGNLQFQSKSKIKAGEGKNSGLYKFFTSSSIQKKFIDEYIFEGPALIFGTGGSASIHYCEEKFSTSTDCFILKSDNKDVTLKYVYYYLFGNIDILEQGFKGAGLKHISKVYISDLEIPLPSIQTQKEIVNKLDKLSELISLRKESIKKQEDLTKSIFIEIFGDPMLNEKGWEVKELENLCTDIIDCPHSTPKFIDDKINGYPSIRTTELKNGLIEWSSMKYVSYETFLNRNKRITPKKGDIIYGREGTFGEAVILPEGSNICLGQRVVLFRPNYDIINSFYLHSIIRSDFCYNQALLKTNGSTVSHINVKDIKKFNIYLPPISLQNKFAEIVRENEENIKKQKESLEKLEELYSGVMQESFRF